MKQILALMFMAVMAMGLWAQDDDYLPFFEDGKVWEYAVYDNQNQKVVHVTDSVCGDIEFQGKKCKIVHRERLSFSEDYIVYENEKRTYYYDEYREKFQPLTDFNVSVGDTVYFVDQNFTYPSTITAIYKVSFQGIERRVIEVDCHTNWLEGIYADDFLVLFNFSARSEISFSENFMNLGYFVECRKDGKVLCTRDDLGLGPLDFWLGVDEIIAKDEAEGPIYDTMGRRVETTQPGHLYIRNGRKFIARP